MVSRSGQLIRVSGSRHRLLLQVHYFKRLQAVVCGRLQYPTKAYFYNAAELLGVVLCRFHTVDRVGNGRLAAQMSDSTTQTVLVLISVSHHSSVSHADNVMQSC